MENVILIIHLILALCLIGVVLLQRSEGGGLGMGGGGGGGVMSARGAATALGKLTWGFAIAFIATSITLTIISAQNAAGNSVLDQLNAQQQKDAQPAPQADGENQQPAQPAAPSGDLLPPSGGDAPLTPPRAD